MAAGFLPKPFAAANTALRRRPFRRLARTPTLTFLAARTRFFDDAVTDGFEAGASQVVIVGAGYDSRAWRLARPGVRCFEVDHPATQADKRARAPADGGPTFVPALVVAATRLG
jgi:methyltransferase (TIGR00027 family)